MDRRTEAAKRRMRRGLSGYYTILRTAKPRDQIVYRLTVPAAIGRMIPEDQEFTVELTEEGILYRALPADAEIPPDPEPPPWARKDT